VGIPAQNNLTLALTGLSAANTRRCALRTQEWLSIITSIRNLSIAVLAAAPATHAATFTPLWTNLLNTAQTNGFYSTYVEVLSHYTVPLTAVPATAIPAAGAPVGLIAPPGNVNLGLLFVLHMAGLVPLFPNPRMPGTDITNVP
jgi:hypothetical protein